MDRRQFLHAGSLGALALCACAPARRERAFDAIVALDPFSRDGVPIFPTLTDAIAAAPAGGTRPYRIRVTRGRWREKLVIDKPHIHLVGDDRRASVLTFDAAARDGRTGGDVWGTWGSASVIVRAPDFSATRLTIENTFDYPGELGKAGHDLIGPNGLQAVALMLDEGSDRASVHDCDILGHQDTLFVDAGRSLFRDCRIVGSVDFIFGGGNAWFERCELHSRHRPARERQGMVAVPSTPLDQYFGLSFAGCRLMRERGVPDASVVLGRPWRPTRTFADGRYGDARAVGAAVYSHCWMDGHIAPEGWDPMAYTARDGTRVLLQPGDARLFEYASRGPGAHATAQRRQLPVPDVQRFTRGRAMAGWFPLDQPHGAGD